jgi:hypothetical protein
LVKLERLWICCHQFVVRDVSETNIESFLLTQVEEVLLCEWHTFIWPIFG